MNVRRRTISNIFITIIINRWVQLGFAICFFVFLFCSREIELDLIIFSLFVVFLFAVLICRLSNEFPLWSLIELGLFKCIIWLQNLNLLNFLSCSKPNAAPISDGSKLYPISEKTNFLS